MTARRRRDRALRMSLPPGPPLPAPVLTAALIAAPSRTMNELHRRYGDIFTIRSLAFGTEVIVTQPATVR